MKKLFVIIIRSIKHSLVFLKEKRLEESYILPTSLSSLIVVVILQVMMLSGIIVELVHKMDHRVGRRRGVRQQRVIVMNIRKKRIMKMKRMMKKKEGVVVHLRGVKSQRLVKQKIVKKIANRKKKQNKKVKNRRVNKRVRNRMKNMRLKNQKRRKI